MRCDVTRDMPLHRVERDRFFCLRQRVGVAFRLFTDFQQCRDQVRGGIQAGTQLITLFGADVSTVLQPVAKFTQPVAQPGNGFRSDSAKVTELHFIKLVERQAGDQLAEKGDATVSGSGVVVRHD